MTEDSPNAAAQSGPRPERELYEPPAVISEQAFETLALSCAGTKADQGCLDNFNVTNS